MKASKVPDDADNKVPQPPEPDPDSFEHHRTALMADAVLKLQRRGNISKDQHDDQIREITQEARSE